MAVNVFLGVAAKQWFGLALHENVAFHSFLASKICKVAAVKFKGSDDESESKDICCLNSSPGLRCEL